MKILIKKMIPQKIKIILFKFYNKDNLKKTYKSEYKTFKKYSFGLTKKISEENIDAMLMYYYHSIEKGLSNIEIRYGFGEKVLNKLINLISEYINRGYDLNKDIYISSVSCIMEYIDLHKKNGYKVQHLEDFIESIPPVTNNGTSGIVILEKEKLIENSTKNFEQLAMNRFSIRDYGIETIDSQKLEKSYMIASKTPSACNRQPWKLYEISDKKKIIELLNIQHGLKSHSKNIQMLLIVTSSISAMNGITERNQAYIDGGLFSMSLIYALTSQGIANCALNSSFTNYQEKKVRELTNIKENEKFIMFISIGSYSDVMKAPLSYRNDYLSKITRL